MIMWSWFVSFDDPTVAWRGAGCGGSAEFNARMKVALGEVVMRHGSKGGVGDKTGITWVAGWGCGGDFTWPRISTFQVGYRASSGTRYPLTGPGCGVPVGILDREAMFCTFSPAWAVRNLILRWGMPFTVSQPLSRRKTLRFTRSVARVPSRRSERRDHGCVRVLDWASATELDWPFLVNMHNLGREEIKRVPVPPSNIVPTKKRDATVFSERSCFLNAMVPATKLRESLPVFGRDRPYRGACGWHLAVRSPGTMGPTFCITAV
ncbi:hypothetical protein V8E55_006697 [Tylopilus felleus]